jgi:YHS domain-containing protein
MLSSISKDNGAGMSEISRRSFIVGAVAAASVGGAARAQSAGSAAGPRVALKGYDPVSYFTDGKPEKGAGEFSFAFDDATYWFKSAEHKAKFAADPERYAPQFDGYCAMQLSRGYKVEADPEAWTITNGKLYVFAGKPAMPKFAKESVAVVEKAKENWPQVSKLPAISLSEAQHR